MRLHFRLTQNNQIVPFDYQSFLIGTFHKWMGWNTIHDNLSLYSLSWLQGGKKVKEGLDFPQGARWFISFWDEDTAKKLIQGIMNEPTVCCGMQVNELQIQNTPMFGNRERFVASSPIFIRKYDDNKKAIHLTYKSEDADYYLTETIKTKLKSVNLDYEVKIGFDRNYFSPKTKLVKINEIQNRATFCPVIIEGDPEAIKFAWNVGVGHSTGCCFGAIC